MIALDPPCVIKKKCHNDGPPGWMWLAWRAGLIDSCEARRRTSSRAAFSADGLCAGRRKTGPRLGDLASSPGAVDLPGSPDDPHPPPGGFLRAAPGLQTRSWANKWLGEGWGSKFRPRVEGGERGSCSPPDPQTQSETEIPTYCQASHTPPEGSADFPPDVAPRPSAPGPV